MKLSITEDEAKFIHQKFYSGNFEVIEITNSGLLDFPPMSFVYGVSDMGSWDGLMSTDGNKFVVTRSAMLDITKVKEVFEFERRDLTSVKTGIFKTTLSLKNNVKGLAKLSSIQLLLICISMITIILPLILFFVLERKTFQLRPKNTFKNLVKFKALLNS